MDSRRAATVSTKTATPRYRIYGFAACPYCRKAKALLEEQRIAYDYVAIEDPAARVAFLDTRGFIGADRTYPRVWALAADGREERLVGGFAELEMDVLLGGA